MTDVGGTTGSAAQRLDRDDPLAYTRDRFELPSGLIYLEGNSLGALPRGVKERVADVVTREWGHDLYASWNTAGWSDLPERVAAKIAPLVGADADEVVAADSTSVNLFNLLAAAVRARPDRRVVVVEPTTFPTDGYIAASVARTFDRELRWCDPADPLAAVDDDTAVVCLTHVDFRTGRKYDESAITAGVHAAGALMLWDLCHTTGAVPFDLHAIDADLAVGCSYKYLNGGSGAPAYSFVARRLHADLDHAITGWWGHAEPFAMQRDYTPRTGIGRLRVGTAPLLSLVALDTALDAFDGVDLALLRAKSLSLTGRFIDLVQAHTDLEVVTPIDPERRGSQVSLRHPEAFGLVQALAARRVVGDFRAPDIARFGFAPLYLRHVDVDAAVEQLVAVLDGEEFARPEYAVRQSVT
ncbi:MAG: kynureninase [Nocardioidaceae bacterium]